VAETRLLALALLACCPHGDILVDHGGGPPDAPAMYDAARSLGCDLRGDVTWTTGVIHCSFYPDGCAGICRRDACGAEIEVVTASSACQTALGHELGHYCLKTEDEDEANAYQAELRKMIGCAP